MKRPKPSVGDTLWVLPVGNAARRGSSPELKESKVVGVGRKYFSLDFNEITRFHIESWTQDTGGYSTCYTLYATKEEHELEVEEEGLIRRVKATFNPHFYAKPDISLHALREIMAIVLEDQQSRKADQE